MPIKETIGVSFPGSVESLPCLHAAGLSSDMVGTGIACTPSPDRGAFHVVNEATGCADVKVGASTWRSV